MRSVGSLPSTAMSIALNARALFRLKVSVVEMKMRLVEDPKRWEETTLAGRFSVAEPINGAPLRELSSSDLFPKISRPPICP